MISEIVIKNILKLEKNEKNNLGFILTLVIYHLFLSLATDFTTTSQISCFVLMVQQIA